MEDQNTEATASDSNESDDRGFGEVSEREDEQAETQTNSEQEETSEQTDNQESKEGTESEENKGQQPQKTEKGTKLDPNPQSAVHQQLANEKRVRGQMESVLADPKLIARFMKEQYGIEVNLSQTQKPVEEKPTTTVKKWVAKDFENIEDVADKFNQIQDQFSQQIAERDKKIQQLTDQVTGINSNGQLRQIAETTESDANSLRLEPELNSKSPDFIPGLEEEIGSLYQKLDFDKETGTFRGKYSLKEVGDMILSAARKARKAGVQRGQTIVRDKSGGRVRTAPVQKQTVNPDTLSPGASIAQGISKMFPRG